MLSPRTKPSRTSLVAFAMIAGPFLYVLSYAPVVRICDGPDPEPPEFVALYSSFFVEKDPEYPLYVPVDWLIDNTPLETPLFIWAECWNVREHFRDEALFRMEREDHRRFLESFHDMPTTEN